VRPNAISTHARFLFGIGLILVTGILRADPNDIAVGNTSGFTFHKTCTTCTATFSPGSTGSNRYMLVEVSVGTNQQVTAISFAGTALNQIGVKTDTHQWIYMFEWANWLTTPVPTTSGMISFTVAGGTTDIALTATVFTNVGAHGTTVSANGQSTNAGANEPSVTIATGARHLVVDGVNANTGTTNLSTTGTNGDGHPQIIIENIDTNAGGGGGAEANLGESVLPGGTGITPVTMSWLLTKGNPPVDVKDNWVMLAVDLVPFTTPTADRKSVV